MTETALKVLVVDDEEPARQRLRDLLARASHIDQLSEAADGNRAAELIRMESPDLVFLDIQMPGLSGLELVECVGIQAMPRTIFVTAYDQFALQAFEANAVDYLLKPFSDERFESALARARARLTETEVGQWRASLPGMLSGASTGQPLDRLVLKSGGTTRFLRDHEIDWLEADGVHVVVHSGPKEFLYRASLTYLEQRLSARLFVRIHRSTLVNIERIEYLSPISHGEFEIVLKTGARLKLSRTFRADLERRLGQPL